MDFQLSEDQSALVSALQAILEDHADIPQSERFASFWSQAGLQDQLEAMGFLDAARDMGPVEAALVIYETAKVVGAVETIGRGLVAPLACPGLAVSGPVALVRRADLGRAIRNLPVAGMVLVEDGEDVLALERDGDGVEPVESILAYPYGRFTEAPALDKARRFSGAAAQMRKWWRVGLAAEIAGAATAAIDFTIEYARNRVAFGRPIGSFQSVQHRLVQRHGYAKSAYYLAMRAAWSGEEIDADVAACHAQSGIRELMFDLHQFNGGMGMTNEHLLHFWIYRVRALQAETGGPTAAALEIADERWNDGHSAMAKPQLSVAGS
ncbi:acyl-CoA dehydrogenase family protein [Novosphingobium sp. BL-52-GroH]|uniref:acyl-CoA dehydrogenase family protein n=1 Tax=Novosphingobium sp. BL-52-GroH TaxID=3349877 RepID=UPI00384E4FFC